MLGWRGKLVLLVIFYLSGFATAVYCLAPPANIPREALVARQSSLGSTASDRVLQALGVALHKAREVGRDLVDRVSVLIQYRYDQQPPNARSADKP
jgi:hypothetical protein